MKKKFQIVCAAVLSAVFISGCTIFGNTKPKVENDSYEKLKYANDELGSNSVFECDVLVIGGGLAGLCAATTAAEAGCSVILIDKMPMIGGNSILSAGTFNAVDAERQEKQGIEDSIELFIKNTYEGGDMLGNIDLITLMCENAGDARKWIEFHGGEWSDSGVYLASGGAWPRSLDVKSSANDTYIRPLAKAVTEKGGKIFRDMKAVSLIMENGRITGVNAVDTIIGGRYSFYGHCGVIIATGGFGANSEMISEYCEDIPSFVESETTPAATGDGIIMALDVGADVVDMEYIQMVPGALDNAPFVTNETNNAIYINKYGKRFVSEESTGITVAKEILKQPGRMAYMLFDSNTIGSEFVDNIGRNRDALIELAKQGACGYGETLTELAQSINVEPEVLLNTVKEFNRAADGDVRDPFGRELFYKKIGDGPFFAAPRTAKVHYTMGGLRIDTDARVLDVNGSAIPGLYACGEVTGGIHATNHVTGNALADCVVFGRIAGQSAVDGR